MSDTTQELVIAYVIAVLVYIVYFGLMFVLFWCGVRAAPKNKAITAVCFILCVAMVALLPATMEIVGDAL